MDDPQQQTPPDPVPTAEDDELAIPDPTGGDGPRERAARADGEPAGTGTALDALRSAAGSGVGVEDPNIVGDVGPTDVPPGRDPDPAP